MNERAVLEGDRLVHEPVAGMDDPVRRVELGEGCTRAVADEPKLVAGRGAAAVEFGYHVAMRLPAREHEDVVAGAAGQRVLACRAVEHVEPALPMMTSLKAEPNMFSKFSSVSVAEPSVAHPPARLTVTPCAAP